MITRIFRAKVDANLKDEFAIKFEQVSAALVKTYSGLISINIGKPTKWSPNEYVMISTWENEAALINFAGKDWNKAFIPDGMGKYIVECYVHHYALYGQNTTKEVN